MSKAFQKALMEARALSPQEQLALIATLSHMLSKQHVFPGSEMIPDDVDLMRLMRRRFCVV